MPTKAQQTVNTEMVWLSLHFRHAWVKTPITLKAPITTAADDKFCNIFLPDFHQTILMKYHTLFVIFEKAAKFEIVVYCKLYVALYGLQYFMLWRRWIVLILPINFCLKNIVCFWRLHLFKCSDHFWLWTSDQTDLGLYCLQYRLTKWVSRYCSFKDA